MKDRLRSAASRLGDQASRLATQAQRLRPGGDRVVSQVDDAGDGDPDAEDLPQLAGSDPVDDELAALDEAPAEPIAIEDDKSSLIELLRGLDATPALPLDTPHEFGFVTLIQRISEGSADDVLNDRRVRRVLDLIGDRLSISVGPDGITVRGLLRRRRTPWERIDKLTFTSRYDLVREDGLQKLTDDIASKVIPLPIPGVKWLLKRVVTGLSVWVNRRFISGNEAEQFLAGAGVALTHIERRGFDIELSGPLLLVSALGAGVSEAVESEARGRGIEIEVQAEWEERDGLAAGR